VGVFAPESAHIARKTLLRVGFTPEVVHLTPEDAFMGTFTPEVARLTPEDCAFVLPRCTTGFAFTGGAVTLISSLKTLLWVRLHLKWRIPEATFLLPSGFFFFCWVQVSHYARFGHCTIYSYGCFYICWGLGVRPYLATEAVMGTNTFKPPNAACKLYMATQEHITHRKSAVQLWPYFDLVKIDRVWHHYHIMASFGALPPIGLGVQALHDASMGSPWFCGSLLA